MLKRSVRPIIIIVLALILEASVVSLAAQKTAAQKTAEPTHAAAVTFAPGPECTTAIVREIEASRQEIRVQAYNFTSPQIIAALIAAHKRGIDVQICLDFKATKQKGSGFQPCKKAGIPVFLDCDHPISHSKVMLIDGCVLVTGSYNFSSHAARNLENLLVIHDPWLVKQYKANWSEHQKHCQ